MALYISYGTVRWHLTNIRKAYNVHSTRELLLAADPTESGLPPPLKFSPRGKEVMELFIRGFTYKEIAEKLGMSRSGVSRHREKMLWQNGCKSMLELIAKYQTWLTEEIPDKAV